MPRLLIACVLGASALKVTDEKRVLFFGCSLDRNALLEFCWDHGTNTEKISEPTQANWCFQKDLNVKLGYIWHPGVGLHGNLRPPFAVSGRTSTGKILAHYANETSRSMLQGDPHLVVVDSSLWDLLVWRLGENYWNRGETGNGEQWAGPNEVTEERVQQWCQQDVPNLLGKVSKNFPNSRIAFRTAPTIDHTPKYEKFEKRDIELLYKCISSSTKKGKLFGKYEVIDYHAIMNSLVDRKLPDLFKVDGFHPAKYPSALYMTEVLRRVGLNLPDPPEPQLEKGKKPERGGNFEAAMQDDPNFLDLM